MKADPTILSQLLAWGRDVPGFTAEHARDGLTLSHAFVDGVTDARGRFVPGLGANDGRSVFLLAMDLAWIFWLDDCFDLRTERSRTDLDALARAAEHAPSTPETLGFARLRERFITQTNDPAAYRLWFETAVDIFRAYQENDARTRGPDGWSYAEYLQNGEDGITVPHVAATYSLLWGLNMPARVSDPTFRRVVSNLSRLMRLQNDYFSVEKERREVNRSNAALIMEDHGLTPAEALAFVRAEMDGLERLVLRDLSANEADPFATFARVLIAGTELFYLTPRDRYRVAPAAAPPT